MTNPIRARRWLRSILAVLLIAPLAPALAGPPANTGGSVEGQWRNKSNTVHIRTFTCGAQLCGAVIWAAPKAEADARAGGTPQLRGTQIFREFRPVGDGGYKGKVFVPDMNRTFAGHLSVTADDKLQGRGCILGGLICKTTVWTRLS